MIYIDNLYPELQGMTSSDIFTVKSVVTMRLQNKDPYCIITST